MPKTGPLAQQNIKDRYYGHNDPVADKMLGRAKGPAVAPLPPEDKTITTLWVGGIDEKTSDGELRYVHSSHHASPLQCPYQLLLLALCSV